MQGSAKPPIFEKKDENQGLMTNSLAKMKFGVSLY